jgi:uncharacterized protein YndB with AHSA1/START domain
MSNPSKVQHASFTIERQYKCAPARVFAAFSDPAKKRRWFAEGEGFVLDAFDMDFRVGGTERVRFRFGSGRPPAEGTPCHNDTWYADIVTDERIVLAYVMTVGGQRISASLATFEFRADPGGTLLVMTEQGAFFGESDGPTGREAGWRQLLQSLARELGEG